MKTSMPGSVNIAMSGGNLASKEKKSANYAAFLLELGLVVLLASVVFSLQVFYLAPRLTLLFDSQGYLWTTQNCQNAINSANFNDIARYFLAGCQDDVLRTAIVSHMPGVLELTKAGPILPGILLIAFTLSGKAISLAHWNVGAVSMIATMVSCVAGIWIFSRSVGGIAAGRISALLALSYGGFIANAGRILTEIPATAISVFALLAAFYFAKTMEAKRQELLIKPDDIRQHYKQAQFPQAQDPQAQEGALELEEIALARKKSRVRYKEIFAAFLPGLFAGFLMLARPTMLPWPLLMGFSFFIVASVSRNKRIFHPAALLAFLLGLSISLLPWSMTKQLLTGSPSIMIERYGPLNLYQGLNLASDGFDALPSSLVQHPDQFNKSSQEVLSELLAQFKERPLAFLHLILRKPSRLLDMPWNDFQISTAFIPLILQRFEHQLLLLAGLFGVVLMLEHGRKRPDYVLLSTGLLLGVFISFHFVSCLFISMSRYFITAMPLVIVAASYFLAYLLKLGRKSAAALTGLLLAPLFSTAFYYMLLPGYGRLSELSADIGLAQLSLIAAILMTAALVTGILLPAFSTYLGARSRLLLCTVALFAGFACFVSTCYRFMASEAVLKLGAVDREAMNATVNIPTGSNCRRWYLVLDANDASVHQTPDKEEGILSGLKLRLNGREFQPSWLPLLAVDKSMRTESMYMAAFAYSGSRRYTDYRQWVCTSLPAENIQMPGENEIVLSLADKTKPHPKIFADYTDPLAQRIHTVSKRRFSWTKGFFADCPGDMRLDEWPSNTEREFDIFRLCGQASRLKARVYLLGVEDNTPSELSYRQINIPPQKVSTNARMRISNFVYPVKNTFKQLVSNPSLSLRIRISGQMRSDKGRSTASIALIEGFRQGAVNYHEFAPLAPESLQALEGKWRDFAFEDLILPLQLNDENHKPLPQPRMLESLKIQFAGRPWWEILDYGLFKGNGTVEFRNLKLELSSQPALDLSGPGLHWYELETQFEPL